MKQGFFEIVSNIPLTESVYKMVLQGDTSDITASGQFVNIKLDGLYLRRPISVCDVEGDKLTIIYKVVGKGTRQMAQMTAGKLDVLTGLGNGYDLTLSGDRPVLWAAVSVCLQCICWPENCVLKASRSMWSWVSTLQAKCSMKKSSRHWAAM